MLFVVAKFWLRKKGRRSVVGPINFGERVLCGVLLLEVFKPPVYCLNYNPPYYKQLFETYGFKLFFEQTCFALRVKDRLQQKFYDRHAILEQDPNFSARYIQKSQLEKFARDFTIVYNKAWAGHGGLKELSNKVVLKMFKAMKPVMDERICWFTYYKDEPIAIWINLPD